MPPEIATSVDATVDHAVAWLNGAVNRRGLDLARDVHGYLLETFFGGSYEAFSDVNGLKPQSFVALCAREDLTLSHATLYSLVRVGEQLKVLPHEVAEALTVRHHRALLPLADVTEKRELAERAAAEGWTASELEAAVRGQRPESRRGRRPLPTAVKEVRALRRTIDVPLDTDGLDDLTPELRRELEDALARVEARLEALRAALVRVDED